MSLSRCRTCNASIRWVEMESGKRMPVDERKVSVILVDRNGENGKVIYGYQSHFATCPQANQHRKGGA